MRFGCCVNARDQIDIIARAGFDYCELQASSVHPFEDDATAEPVLRILEGALLRAEAFNVLVPPQLPMAGPHVDHAALRAYLRRAFSRMVRLGGRVVVLGSGGARRIPDSVTREQGLAQLAVSLAIAAEEAGKAGITLALEHLNRKETNVFNSLDESLQFISVVHPHLAQDGMRLLADLYHLEVEGETLQHVTDAGAYIAHVHVAGGNRRAPDVTGYDYAGFMHRLHAIGYDQRISAECGWEDLDAQAAGALDFMRRSWSADSR
jgi:D-psicose/D-tagatose/L-ribulose 3-epimerase